MNYLQEMKQEVIEIDKLVIKLEMFKTFNTVNNVKKWSDKSEYVETFINKQIENFANDYDEYNNTLHGICGMVNVVGVEETINDLIKHYKKKRLSICDDILKNI